MKIKPRFFVVGFLIVIVIAGYGSALWGQTRLEQRLSELLESVGTREVLAEQGEEEFGAFVGDVMPELIDIDKQLGLEKQLEAGERVEDVMAFAYEIARARLWAMNRAHVDFGYWSEDRELMRREVGFVAWLMCFTEWLLLLKPEEYGTQMRSVRQILYDDAYNRLIVSLSLKNPLFTVSEDMIQVAGVPSVEDFINLDAVQMIKKADR